MPRSSICQTEATHLLELCRPIFEAMLEKSASSEADIGAVESAIGVAIQQLRGVLVSLGVSLSIKQARHDYICPACAQALTGWGHRSRRIVTSQGEAVIEVPRYRCTACERSYSPFLAGNGLLGTEFTLKAKERIVEEAADEAYAGVSERLPELGVQVSAKEVDRLVAQASEWQRCEQEKELAWHRQEADRELRARLFVETRSLGEGSAKPAKSPVLYDWRGWECQEWAVISVDGGMVRSPVVGADGKLIWFEERSGLIRPLGEAPQARTFHTAGVQDLDAVFECLEAVWRSRPKWVKNVVFVSDDGNGLQSRAEASFPGAIHMVDCFHAGEHVGEAADAAWGPGSSKARPYKIDARTPLLEPQGVQRVIKRFLAVLRKQEAVDREGLCKAIRYLWRNRRRMKYAQWQSQGLPVGSGAMESAIKQVCVARLRRAGMMWTRSGADNMLRIRSASLSGTLDTLCERKRTEYRQYLNKFFSNQTYNRAV